MWHYIVSLHFSTIVNWIYIKLWTWGSIAQCLIRDCLIVEVFKPVAHWQLLSSVTFQFRHHAGCALLDFYSWHVLDLLAQFGAHCNEFSSYHLVSITTAHFPCLSTTTMSGRISQYYPLLISASGTYHGRATLSVVACWWTHGPLCFHPGHWFWHSLVLSHLPSA